MPYGLYVSAEGAFAQSKRLEVLSNNLANVDTPGFKRELTLFQARNAEAVDRGLDYSGSRSANDISGGVLVRETTTDFSAGLIRQTGIDTDLALDNENAFFVVEKNGEHFLTRAGNFQIDSSGQLVTQQGRYPVLNDAGNPIVVDPALGPAQFSPSGGVVQGDTTVNLALVRPQSLGDLVKSGENLFRPLAEPVAIADEDRRVQSGYLEASGVKPTTEMMELIEASRAFEANTNMIKNQDEMLGTLINRALKSPN